MNRSLLDDIAHNLNGSPGSLKTSLAFAKKVLSFHTRPQNPERLRPFCGDAGFMAALRQQLPQHGSPPRDTMPFWSLVACLLIDAVHNGESLVALSDWARARVAARDGQALDLFLEYLHVYAAEPALTALRAEVALALDALLGELPVARWFEALGLRRPAAGRRWSLSFALATVERRSQFSRLWVSLPDDAFEVLITLRSHLREGTNSQQDMIVRCSAMGGTVGTDFGDGHFALWRGGLLYPQLPIDLLRLPEHIRSIEAFYGIRFLRESLSGFGKSGLHQRDIEARIVAWFA